jgi:hypothetical protein
VKAARASGDGTAAATTAHCAKVYASKHAADTSVSPDSTAAPCGSALRAATRVARQQR